MSNYYYNLCTTLHYYCSPVPVFLYTASLTIILVHTLYLQVNIPEAQYGSNTYMVIQYIIQYIIQYNYNTFHVYNDNTYHSTIILNTQQCDNYVQHYISIPNPYVYARNNI